jgi:hypothetical protein
LLVCGGAHRHHSPHRPRAPRGPYHGQNPNTLDNKEIEVLEWSFIRQKVYFSAATVPFISPCLLLTRQEWRAERRKEGKGRVKGGDSGKRQKESKHISFVLDRNNNEEAPCAVVAARIERPRHVGVS